MLHIPKAIRYKKLDISSPVFIDSEMIPVKYTCEGENINPPLDIKNIPEEAASLVLIVDDPDTPINTWVHWTVWNIPITHHIKENSIHGVEGRNDFGQQHYSGPGPPAGTHRYFFKIYALNSLIDLPGNATKLQLEKAMSEHIVAFGELIGLYRKKNK
ncbi:MAG: YbhB/YbcL family Raf kinase inhibitor-like protein [Chitinophagaceae bacterium]